jgi:hypothetical protein
LCITTANHWSVSDSRDWQRTKHKRTGPCDVVDNGYHGSAPSYPRSACISCTWL